MTRFGLMIDFRNPPEARRPDEVVYRETLQTVRIAEDLGYDDVWLSEHHATPDGYCPAPLAVSAAIAATTSRIAIGQALLLLPLHHPLRIAEDGAVVDVISGGRFSLGVGIGYRPKEFEAFGIERSSRVPRLIESLSIIDQAWRTGHVDHAGEHWTIRDVEIRPLPVQRPRPPFWLGGLTEPAVRRAARYGDGLLAAGRRAHGWYTDELARLGRATDSPRIAGAHEWFFVSDDPQHLLARVAPHLKIYHNTVVGYFDSAQQEMPMGSQAGGDLDEVLRNGRYVFCTPDEAVQRLTGYLQEVPVSHFYLLGGLPGLPAEVAREWLTTFAEQVAPRVRAGLAVVQRP